MRIVRLCSTLILVAAASGCVPRSPTRAPLPTPPLRHIPIGLCEDYPEESRSLAEVERDLALAAAVGATVLRVSIGWDDVEPRDDAFVFDFWDRVVALAQRHRVRLIPYVAYGPGWAADGPEEERWRHPPRDPAEFGEVMAVLAQRYRGRIGSWELWNEPDNADYWRGTVAEYAELVRAGAAGVRRGDPHARVVLGGLAGKVEFLHELFRHGVAEVVDVVNAHAYYETWNGEPLERVRSYLDEVAAAVPGAPKPIWLAEVGYSTHRRGAVVSPSYRARYIHEHTPAFAASALLRTMVLALASPHVSLIAWYELKDARPADAVIGDENNRHLGIAYADHRPKPALGSLRFVTRRFAGGHRPVALAVQVAPALPVEAHGFVFGDGTLAVFAWLPTNPEGALAARPSDDGARSDDRRGRLVVRVPCAGGTARALDEQGRGAAALPLHPDAAGARLELDVVGTAVTIAEVAGCQAPAAP